MKNILFVSIFLALFSFGTTVLVYDFSQAQNSSNNTKIVTEHRVNFPPPSPESTASTTSEVLADPALTSPTDDSTTKKTEETIAKSTPKTPIIINPPVIKKEPTVSSTQVSTNQNNMTPPKSTTPTTSPEKPMSGINKTPISWGVFAGSNPTVIHDFETRVKENPDYLAYFVHWGNGEGALPAFLSDYAYKKDRTLVLFWEASDYKLGGTDQPAYSYSAMLRGDFDDYFVSFAKQLKKYEGPVILIPFSELNGNWTPWSGTKNGNTPAQAVAAFQYVHGFFADIPNVKIGWAVNSASVPNTEENQIANYYPGDDYVDIVGVDGFNMNNPWLSFNEIFGNALRIVSQYNKPVFVFSFGSAEGPKKAEWLRDALYTQIPSYPLIEGWIYFNQNKERNWLLWSDEATFSVFKDYISR